MKNKTINKKLLPFVSATIIAISSISVPFAHADDSSARDQSISSGNANENSNQNRLLDNVYKIPGTENVGLGIEKGKKIPEDSSSINYSPSNVLTENLTRVQKAAIIATLSIAESANSDTLTENGINLAKSGGYLGSVDNLRTKEVREGVISWAVDSLNATLDKGNNSTMEDRGLEKRISELPQNSIDEIIEGSKVVIERPDDNSYKSILSFNKSEVPNVDKLNSIFNQGTNGSEISLRTTAKLLKNEDQINNSDRSNSSEKFQEISSKINKLVVDSSPRPNKKYDRKDYKHWSNVSDKFNWSQDLVSKYKDCTTRNAVLLESGDKVSQLDDCKIKVENGGGWDDLYGTVNGSTVSYEDRNSDPSKIDIDHIVPLKEVWRSGGYKLSEDDREKVANDFDNLVATTQKTNRSKSDASAEVYLPPSEFRCDYISKYTTVKDRYDLTVTEKEKNRLLEEWDKCGNKIGNSNSNNNSESKIVDTVYYKNLNPGSKYTMKGELFDTDSNKSLNREVKVEFTPEKSDGQVEVSFETKGLDSKKITVFETLLDSEGNKISEHRDISDRAQTVNLEGNANQNSNRRGVRITLGGQGNDSDKSRSGISIDTKATASTGDNIQSGTTVDDKVMYKGLTPNNKYRLEARLICKKDGKDTKAFQTHEFTPNSSEGSVVVKDIVVKDPDCLEQVVFEKLYKVNSDNSGELIATHEDLEDKDQTVGGEHVGKKKKKTEDETTPTSIVTETSPYPVTSDSNAPRQLINNIPSGSSSSYGSDIFNR